MWIYELMRTHGSAQWPKGVTIQALQPCKGWRVIGKQWYEPQNGIVCTL